MQLRIEFTASTGGVSSLRPGCGIAGDLAGLVRRGGDRRQAHVLAKDVAHLADRLRVLLHAVVGRTTRSSTMHD